MKKIFVAAMLLFLLSLGIAFSDNIEKNDGKVDDEVEEILEEEGKASVIVVLEDDYNALEKYSDSKIRGLDESEKEKIMISEQQDKILANLKEEEIENKIFGIIKSEPNNDYRDIKLENKFTSVNGFSAEVNEEGLEKLKNNPDVKEIYPNREVRAFLNDSRNIVEAAETWKLVYNGKNLTGSGETICVIDTGVDYTHSDLGNCQETSNINDGSCGKVIGGYDFVNNDENPIDDNGHGTHVAGIIASTNDIYRGIAPDANIVAIKILGSGGSGNGDDLVSGISWCVDNSSIFNITAISMSLGTTALFSNYCDDDDLAISYAIDKAIEKNISVVAATGNDGSTTSISSPACIRNATAVGGVSKNDGIVFNNDFNRNNITDLLAPGVGIISTSIGGGTVSNSGTSMATPHVSAAFALVHQYFKLTENKNALPNEIQVYLNSTGKRISDSGSGLTFSRINIFEAIISLDSLAPSINITFTDPANNSNTSNKSIFVNITSAEVLSKALLEIDGSNATMNGSGLKWHINRTGLANGTYPYLVYGNDSSGNIGISDARSVTILNTVPNITSFFPDRSDIIIAEPNNQTFNITYTDPDGDTLNVSWYKNGTLSPNSFGFNFTGNFTTSGFYNISVIVSDGMLTDTKQWNLTVNESNRVPLATNVTINSTDGLNRTNSTLIGLLVFSDPDDNLFNTYQANETKWYNNSKEVLELANYTEITPNYIKKSQNWTFSARAFDGLNWSEWANSTRIEIRNTAPEANISIDSIIINETHNINITANAFDYDNDELIFTINDTRFSLIGTHFIGDTSLDDAGNYLINITVNDTELTDSKIINVTILDARDLDDDGNPDFNDTDDDNDGILDGNDFVAGNLSAINASFSLNLTINGTTNLSKSFNGTFTIIMKTDISNNLTNSTLNLVEFDFTFNSSNVLDIGAITANYTFSGFSGLSLRGFTRPSSDFTKNFTIDKINATAKAICIKDADAGLESISSNCNGAKEILITCNNNTQGQYTCYDTGLRYKITGLNHSAVKELCMDNDGDGYGNGCTLGEDCNDNDRSKTIDCSSGSGDSGNGGGGGGGGGGGSGGGGGGGGGSGLFYTCNMEWKCNEWAACENGWQLRECSFEKVPQHTQKEQCPSQDAKPERAKKCQLNEKTETGETNSSESLASLAANENGIYDVQNAQNTSSQSNMITGAAVAATKSSLKSNIPIIALIMILVILFLKFGFEPKEKKKQEHVK